ncbi:hypothetical protein CERZMDRAFT_7941, partial [Cercospora zeae-maydis SCOH1-5]
LLDGALPPHLRDPNLIAPDSILGADDVAQLLLEAQYPLDGREKPIDLLYHLGMEQNRWTAVVWLIKKLVDEYPARHALKQQLAGVGSMWQKVPNLEDCIEQPLNFEVQDAISSEESLQSPSLDDMLDGLYPINEERHAWRGHEALGQVWRTLGAMVKSCVGNDIRPEVLEIIAYLHHREVMPPAIYQAEPSSDKCAIQQSPLIPLLSSRILTSLSDAAWRAHEKLVIEEARAYGDVSASRPEIRGSVFRVHVAGLRAEVWMELILWSCLYGGWTREGALLLTSLLQDQTNPWTPLSWAHYQKSLDETHSTEPSDWRAWEFLFKTRSTASMNDAPPPNRSIVRTISGEVVNAYVDAFPCDVNLGVGDRGTPIGLVIDSLHSMRSSLMRQDQSLSFGTWEAIVLRLVDTHSAMPEIDSHVVQRMIALSNGFGEGLSTSNNRDLPAYVKDGSTAMQGILHRALYGQVASGSFEGALEVFKQIQMRADQDILKAVASFFGKLTRGGDIRRKENSMFHAMSSSSLFANNFPTIEYPSFHVQIPTTTLAPFLEQITEARAFEFGRWLIYKADVDGPVIPQSAYTDATLQPALIRFAAASGDRDLLSQFRKKALTQASLSSILISQIQARRWDDATEAMNHISSTPGVSFGSGPLAVAIRTMLWQSSDARKGKDGSAMNLAQAQSVVRKLARRHVRRELRAVESATSPLSLLAVLAAVTRRWFEFALRLCNVEKHHLFQLDTSKFNIVLEGIVAAYGSSAGRRVLGVFWPHAARRAHDTAFNTRIAIRSSDEYDSRRLVFYGAVQPDINTILIILRKALEELQSSPDRASPAEQQPGVQTSPDPTSSTEQHPATSSQIFRDGDELLDVSPRGMVTWGIRRLAQLPYVQRDIVRQLDEFLEEQGMDELRKELPEIYQDV